MGGSNGTGGTHHHRRDRRALTARIAATPSYRPAVLQGRVDDRVGDTCETSGRLCGARPVSGRLLTAHSAAPPRLGPGRQAHLPVDEQVAQVQPAR